MSNTTSNHNDSNSSHERPLEDAVRYFNEHLTLRGLVRSTHPVSGRRVTRLGADCEDGMRINERHLESSYNLNKN